MAQGTELIVGSVVVTERVDVLNRNRRTRSERREKRIEVVRLEGFCVSENRCVVALTDSKSGSKTIGYTRQTKKQRR